MAQVTYGKLRISYSSLEELAKKIANYLEIDTLPIDYAVVKAHIRVKAELVSREKRAGKEGKEVKVKSYTDI